MFYSFPLGRLGWDPLTLTSNFQFLIFNSYKHEYSDRKQERECMEQGAPRSDNYIDSFGDYVGGAELYVTSVGAPLVGAL